MKVLLTGAGGQLGRALQATSPATVELLAPDRAALDIREPGRIREVLRQWHPQVIVNAAAYTFVDRAESAPALAFAVNAEAPRHLAEAARETGCRLMHVSTDFVFAGERPLPYDPGSATRPLSTYGESKRAGELAVISALGDAATVLRTSWLYGSSGRNFVLTMLDLLRSRESVDVVYDQVGSPTWSISLARAIWAMAEHRDIRGVHHWCDDGVASWYDFAVAIQEESVARGLLSRGVPIRAIRSEDYPTPARRPAYSVLDKRSTVAALGFSPAHWRTNLRLMLDELVRS